MTTQSGQQELHTAYEAGVLQLFLFPVLLGSEVSKGVDDDTKDEVLKDDHNDTKKEREVMDHSDGEHPLVKNDNIDHNMS